MKARKIVIFALLAILILSTLACGGGGEEEEEEGVTELKIGFGLPLSGILGAVVGIAAKQAYELTCDRIGVFEVGGKQYRWDPVFEDNEGGSAAGGLATTTKFIYTDHVDIVTQAGVAAMTAQTLCEENGVIIDMGSAPFESFGADCPHSIQSGPCVTFILAPFYDWLANEHPEVERIVIVAPDDPLTVAFAEAFESNMHEYFGFEREIVWTPMGITDPYPVATNVMMLDPDLTIANTQILDIMWV